MKTKKEIALFFSGGFAAYAMTGFDAHGYHYVASWIEVALSISAFFYAQDWSQETP